MLLTAYNANRVKIPPTTTANDRRATGKEKKRGVVAMTTKLARGHLLQIVWQNT